MRKIILIVIILFPFNLISQVNSSSEQESELFEKGIENYTNGNFEEALDIFSELYQKTDKPIYLYHIGLCLFRLKRFIDAKESFEEFLNKADQSIPERIKNSARLKLQDAKLQFGIFTIVGIPPGEIATYYIDGNKIGTLPEDRTIYLLRGKHTVSIEVEGYKRWSKSIEVKGGEEEEIEVELIPEKEEKEIKKEVKVKLKREKRFSPWDWISLGLGTALTAVGIALIALDGYCPSEYRTEEGCHPDHPEVVYKTMTPGIITTTVGGLGLLVGIVLVILDYTITNSSTETSSYLRLFTLY